MNRLTKHRTQQMALKSGLIKSHFFKNVFYILIIVIEQTTSIMRKSSKSRSRSSRPQRAATYNIEIELMMECDEDELSPVQKLAHKKAQQEHNSVRKILEQYKANNAEIQILKVPLTPDQIIEVESKPSVKVEEFYSEPVITYTPLPPVAVSNIVPTQQVCKKSTTKAQALPPRITTPIQVQSPFHIEATTVTPTSTRPQRKAAKNASKFLGNTCRIFLNSSTYYRPRWVFGKYWVSNCKREKWNTFFYPCRVYYVKIRL